MNKKVKALLSLLALAAAVTYLVMASAFIAGKEREQRCQSISVAIADADERSFVSVDDVKSILLNGNQRLIGEPLHKINVFKLEELLSSKSLIAEADVFFNIDGELNVTVHQRKAVVRIDTQGTGFYIDESGFVFPLTKSYTDNVPIVTGSVPLPFAIGYKGEIPDSNNTVFLKKMLTFALFIRDNPFWEAMVEQINVVSENNVEIITRTGSQVVTLGTLDDYEYKLHKLEIFYKKAMPTVGWSKYRSINLAYGNQVICK